MASKLDQAQGADVNPDQPHQPDPNAMRKNASLDMGWGRLLFAQTFESNDQLVETLCDEAKGARDVAFYLRDPHVVLSLAPQTLFLDPSHTYRLKRDRYKPSQRKPKAFDIRLVKSVEDAIEVNRIYKSWDMVTCDPKFMVGNTGPRQYLVAVSKADGQIIGTAIWIDHVEAFNDPGNGSSLWCLAVDPQAQTPGVGEWLVRSAVEKAFERSRAYVDLSVMHDNKQAIALYEKLGFRRESIFCVKLKNPINEPLFVGPQPEEELNPYAQIIVREAHRRGIMVDVIDAGAGYFRLHFGGRSVICRESLTELTTAIAMSRCDDKRVTRKVLEQAGLRVPDQQPASPSPDRNAKFLETHSRVVVKPARGEQGAGISVDVRTAEELAKAIELAHAWCPDVILEQMVAGQDLRVIVIDFQVVAAAVRRPPVVVGTGQHTVRELIEKYNRRRMRATGGESQVPMDSETQRCIELEGFTFDDVPPPGKQLMVRRAANLHTGGTIHDVTAKLHPTLIEASVQAATALDIPVVGLDLLVEDVEQPDYVIIEANERPGLANHEPQPTAERFIDFLFPQSVAIRE